MLQGLCKKAMALPLASARIGLLVLISFGSINPSEAQEQIVAPDASKEVQAKLLEAWQSQDEDYVPRTEHHLPDGSPRYINRLIEEDSPYLLQHAHNPVNWYPWGAEAFAAAVADEQVLHFGQSGS